MLKWFKNLSATKFVFYSAILNSIFLSIAWTIHRVIVDCIDIIITGHAGIYYLSYYYLSYKYIPKGIYLFLVLLQAYIYARRYKAVKFFENIRGGKYIKVLRFIYFLAIQIVSFIPIAITSFIIHLLILGFLGYSGSGDIMEDGRLNQICLSLKNRETIYEKQTSSSYNVAPGQWLSSTSSAIRSVGSWTEFGSKAVKTSIKTYNAMKDNGDKGFWEVFGFQGKIDTVQIDSRNENKNFLTDSEEYNSLLVKDGILDKELNTVFYLDGTTNEDGSYTAGYSQKYESEIGINLSTGGKQTSTGDLENTYWHEVSHQYDTTNTSEQDRENFATNMGNSAQSMGNINNFLYGDGGLNDTTLSTYIYDNKSQLLNNSEYFHSLNPNELDYLKTYSRPLTGWESLYGTSISKEHFYNEATITKGDFDKLNQLYNMGDVPVISKNEIDGTVTLLISGFPSENSIIDNALGKNDLMVKFSAKEDLVYHNDSNKHHLVAENSNYQADYNAVEIAFAFSSNYDNGQRLDYALTPELFEDKYNSNSFGVSLAKYATEGLGGMGFGVQHDFIKETNSILKGLSLTTNPGANKIIPKEYFAIPPLVSYSQMFKKDYVLEYNYKKIFN
ncbi:MAG: hypothetical protein LBQ34_03115 [Alphaproteobacteria bacterium]|jgi:hypothetical protein|nr:hypothetical protein [Alphaproteobacteria bacterium]